MSIEKKSLQLKIDSKGSVEMIHPTAAHVAMIHPGAAGELVLGRAQSFTKLSVKKESDGSFVISLED